MKRPQSRRDLEIAVRSMVPRAPDDATPLSEAKSTLALTGLSGVAGGFLWGYFRGRRTRKSKRA
jgi:hypothetical protein